MTGLRTQRPNPNYTQAGSLSVYGMAFAVALGLFAFMLISFVFFFIIGMVLGVSFSDLGVHGFQAN